MTDSLLLALIVAVIGGSAVLYLLARRSRMALDRRLKRIERRLDELLGRHELADAVREIDELFDTATDQQRRVIAENVEIVLERIDERTLSLRPGKHSVEQRTRRAVAQDVHALLSLHRGFPLVGESLLLSGYAASPDTILHLTTLVAALPNDALVVEFGSGLSTVWMSAAADREARGIRIVSIDHDEHWGAQTAAALDRLGLGHVAEVRVAPLEPLPRAAEGDTPWYALGALDGLDGIRLLVVDGPPAATGPAARYPAVPCLAERLAPDARIVLDDTDRAEERAIAERWITELGPERGPVVERVLDRTTVIRLGAPAA